MYRNVASFLKLWSNFDYWKSQKSNLILGLFIFIFGFRLYMASILKPKKKSWHTAFFFFFLLAMESQKVIINIIKNAKIRYFSRFSIAKNWPKFKKTRQISIQGSQVGVAKIKEGCFFFKWLSYLACSQIWLNLLPIWTIATLATSQNWPKKKY